MQWFRSVHGAPTHKKWLTIARKSGQPVPVVVSVVWALLDHASRQEDRGSVEGFDAEDAASYLGIDDEGVLAVLATLADRGWIVDGRIGSWEEHQVKREREDSNAAERAKAWREAQKDKANATERQPNANEHLDTDTDTDIDIEVKKEGGRAKRTQPRGTRLPDDWMPSRQNREYAADRRGWDPPQIEAVAEDFRDYWVTQPGQRGVKTDWDRTWQRWVRNQHEPTSQGNRTPGQNPTRRETERAENVASMLRVVAADEDRRDTSTNDDGFSEARGVGLPGPGS